jgi:hypothetical protein
MITLEATDDADMRTAEGAAEDPVGLPINEFAAKFAIFERDTVPAPMVVDMVALPEPEMSPVKVCN